MLTVRYPDFDFTDSEPQWGDNHEAVAVINAGAIIPSPIERYLIRVMRQAKKQLDPVADADLIETVDLFNKQEGQHLKLHTSLLQLLEQRYPLIREYEAAYEADLERFLENETLEWNLGYCEGFESSGCAVAEAWVNGVIADICGDHGSMPMRLWRWHLAEEFEHRAVVHDVIHRLYGADRALEIRSSGATFNRDHIAGHTLAAVVHIMDVDRAELPDDEAATLDERVALAGASIGAASGERMQWVFDPNYDPAKVEPPRDYELALAYAKPK